MPRKIHFLTEDQFITIGRRYGSGAIANEASRVAAVWKRDEAVLAEYGHGPAERTQFEADRLAHAQLCAARPQAVATKRTAVQARDQRVSQAWTWVDKVTSILAVQARNDQKLAFALTESTPSDDSDLPTGIEALAGLLEGRLSTLPPEKKARERLTEVKSLCESLRTVPGELTAAKAQPLADTAQIDLYDGKLYVWMRDLHRAARSAIRNRDLKAQSMEYSFHDIKRSGSPTPPVDPPVTPAGPTTPIVIPNG